MFNYPPAKENEVQRFCSLNGEFRRSNFAEGLLKVFACAMILTGAWLLGLAYGRWQRDVPAALCLLPLFIGLALVTCGTAVVYLRAGMRYRFEGRVLSEIGSSGAARWSEPLDGMSTYIRRSGRGLDTLQLIWPDRKRTIELVDSLSRALEERSTSDPSNERTQQG